MQSPKTRMCITTMVFSLEVMLNDVNLPLAFSHRFFRDCPVFGILTA